MLRFQVTDVGANLRGRTPTPSVLPRSRPTGRVEFTERLRDAQRTARRKGQTVALWLVGLEGLARMHEGAGTRAAEQLAEQVLQTVQSTLGEAALVARHGRSQVAAYASNVSRREAELWGQRLRARVSITRLDVNEQRLSVEPSVGVALYRPEGSYRSEADLVAAAQEALDGAHRSGGNRVILALDPAQVTAPRYN